MNPSLIHLLGLFLLSHPSQAQRYPVEVRVESVTRQNTILGLRQNGTVFVRDKDGFREDRFLAFGCRAFPARGTRPGFDQGEFDQSGRLKVTFQSPASAPNVCTLKVTREGELVTYHDIHR